MTSANSGLALVDKPAGLTSQQAVLRVRRNLGADRAGHTGTLDPFATGLLVVLVDRATRLASFVQDEPKEYEALIRFGVETDTDDATGVSLRTAPLPGEPDVARAIRELSGEFEQTPPAFSAKHVAGKRAYRLARQGIRTDLRPVRVHVHRWDVLQHQADTLHARIVCSGGTYIRALARDMGRLTNSAAHCAALRRLRCGPFHVDDAVQPDAVTPAHMRPALAALAGLPTEVIGAAQALGVAHGRPAGATVPGQWAALVKDSHELLAVAERQGDEWHPRVVLADA